MASCALGWYSVGNNPARPYLERLDDPDVCPVLYRAA